MRRLMVLVVAVLGVSCAENNKTGGPRGEEHPQAMAMAPTQAMAPAGEHVVIRPAEVKWQAGPPSLPAGAKFVVLEGDPAKRDFFAMRLMMPDGFVIPPHWHPGAERVTVISGTFHLGMGEKLDRAAAQALPAGTYSSMQPGMRHFAWAEGPTVVQVTSVGPWGINYVNPADDPRNKK
jgi:Domain of unknown function (DUF4437)